jgi:glycosyltransferase involved in cell wall biosynthesis
VATGFRRTIFVDLAPLQADGGNGGAALLVIRLLRGLLARRDAHEYHLLVKRAAESAVSDLIASGAVLHPLGPGLDVEEPRRIRREIRRLPRALSRLFPDPGSLVRRGADVLFSPLGTAAFHEAALRHVAVIHDGFQELTFPDFFSEKEKRRRRAFRSDLGRVDRIVAVSESARVEALGHLGLPADRIVAVPNAIGLPAVTSEAARVPLSPGDPSEGSYLVYPANAWPHKNHERLIRAFALAAPGMENAKLVLCGDWFSALPKLERLASDRGIAGRVVFLPFLPEKRAWATIRGARALVFPSLYEGFGIPVLEAMALGTPVACSRIAALEEVAGDAALFFDPTDETSVADALQLVWASPSTREALAEAGRRRASRYAALDAVGTYHRLLTF